MKKTNQQSRSGWGGKRAGAAALLLARARVELAQSRAELAAFRLQLMRKFGTGQDGLNSHVASKATRGNG
ncbi:hypothetical protein [Enterobacter ludwigii]|uniref:hypothetical protein n=1 Tax=Enterobacter ludwigii TaxID=299767 RepID=UPI000642DE51|nr:hypothetical protein [Enterobacter ludwigii]KLP39516.1 hypothetical protein ABR36_10945 [Enterobacter ludwigii]